MEIQIHAYVLEYDRLLLLGSLENVCQIMHDSATLELKFATTYCAQEWWTLILDLFVGIGIATDGAETELAERIHCEKRQTQRVMRNCFALRLFRELTAIKATEKAGFVL